MIGRTLSHFRILEKLGEGGMGVVYRAEDTQLRRPVALKVLPPDLVGNEERRLRFLREARAAAAVTHPNIAVIHEVGEAEGQVFIAMELVGGRTLHSLIAGKPLSLEEALAIGMQVGEGMARAHERGVIHRDLKPQNVVVGPDGIVKILDFGLAKLLIKNDGTEESQISRMRTVSQEVTREGSVLGTVSYMSPEQARGDEVDARSDLFSYGILLYEMVTGSLPFQGRTALDTLSAILNEEPRLPAEVNPEVPAELERIISKCLEKEARNRYQRSEDVLLDLKRLRRQIESGGAGAQAVGLREQAPRSETHGRRSPVGTLGALGFPRWVAVSVGAAAIAAGLILFNAGGWRERLFGEAPAGIDSLAVLPLANLSGDPGQEYFADGMTEALIADLAQIPELRVISRTSVMQYKGKSKPAREIGAELDVDALVEGSVIQSGERVRITAQLIEAATDRHLWAHSYERDLRDVLALQGEVTRAIVREIQVKLSPQVEARLSGARAVNPEAYRLYLQGSYHVRGYSEEGIRKGMEYLERAIAIDPEYAPAHAGLAWAYHAISDSPDPPLEAGERAQRAALRALEIDDHSAEGHAAMALILVSYGWDPAAGEREAERAIDLNANIMMAHVAHSWALWAQGRYAEAVSAARRATEVDPLSAEAYGHVAFTLHFARDYDGAIAEARKALDLTHDDFWAHFVLGLAYEQKGNWNGAITEFQKARELNDIPWTLAYLGHAYAGAGQTAEARRILADLQRQSTQRYVAGYDLALICAALGEKEQALDYLERAYRDRSFYMPWLGSDPRWDSLRQEPRFKDLLRRTGFADGRIGATQPDE